LIYDRRNFLLAALLIGVGTAAHAQEKYPTRPIRLLVPFPAGGPVDVMGRLIAQRPVIDDRSAGYP
jgi:tripartite-type tricarboxylate transporter receptor subunit TctC